MKTTLFNAMLAITMMMCSCEKFTSEEECSKPIPGENNVSLEISSKGQVKKVCKNVSFGFSRTMQKQESLVNRQTIPILEPSISVWQQELTKLLPSVTMAPAQRFLLLKRLLSQAIK